MTWVWIGLLLILGFGEYLCAHYFICRTFGLKENKAHLILGSLVLTLAVFPKNYILAAFFVTAFATPLLVWLGLRGNRHTK